jgi:nucleoside-diphosphate-sugar epimerase
MRVIVLGGRGAAGRALIRELQGEPGTEIVGVTRKADDLPGVSRTMRGDYSELAGTEAFLRELAKANVVIHLGDGLTVLERHANRRDQGLADRLVAASSALALAACHAKVPLFIYVSSIKAIADEDDSRVLVEDSEPRGTTLYGRSKLTVERSVADSCAGSAMRYIILRPPVLYGEDTQGSVHRLLKLADSPWPLPLGGLSNRRSLLATNNLASLLAHLARHGTELSSGCYHVHDGAPLSTTQIVDALRAGLGRSSRLFSAELCGRVAGHMPGVGPTARRLFGSLEVSDARLRQSISWAPPMSSQAALAQMARAYRAD